MTTLEIARIADARASSNGWIAKCRAHTDRSPSLSIREGRNGKTLVRCFAGCEPAQIAHSFGLQLRDFFADDGSARRKFTEPTVRSRRRA